MKPTQEQLQEAERLFPMPKFTRNYLDHFPKKQFYMVEIMQFAIGFIMTAIRKDSKDKNATWYVQGIATLIFLLVLVGAGTWHTIAWVKMRIVERKRAKWLGVSLQEYWEAVK